MVRRRLGGPKAEQIGRVVHPSAVHQPADRAQARKTGLLTTAGFRDVLESVRERKYDL